jgi:hypothetical protein
VTRVSSYTGIEFTRGGLNPFDDVGVYDKRMTSGDR